MIRLQDLADKCVQRCKLDYDVTIAVTGEEGIGKSSMAISLARKIGKRKDGKFTFCLSKNVLFSPSFENVQEAIKTLPKYAPIVLDEAIKVLYKLRWHDKIQILLNQFFAICRQENKIAILCIPRFTDLNEYFRNHRVKIWIHVIDRGKAFVFVKDRNPFVKDCWHFQEMQKKMEKHNFNALSYRSKLKLIKKNKSFVGIIKFRDLPTAMQERYKKLKELKKYNENSEEVMGKVELLDLYKQRWFTAILHLHKWGYVSMKSLAQMFNLKPATVRKYFRDKKEEFEAIPLRAQLQLERDNAFREAIEKKDITDTKPQDVVLTINNVQEGDNEL